MNNTAILQLTTLNLTGHLSNSTNGVKDSNYNMTMTIAIITWALLICLTLFICCCNYWQVLRPPAAAGATPLQCQYSQSENQQSTLLSQED